MRADELRRPDRQPPHRLKLLLVTVGLEAGGTEGQILELATRLDRQSFDVTVCELKQGGVVADELRARGIRVVSLGGERGWDVRVLLRLAKVLREERPDVLHTFLFYANLASRIATRLVRVPVLISSYRDAHASMPWARLFTERLTAHLPQAITCCSEAVRRWALGAIGGRPDRFLTIHNGVDTRRFSDATAVSKAALGLHTDAPIIGTVCRLFEPKKGLGVLLQAMERLVKSPHQCVAGCQLVIVGKGPALEPLQRLASKLGIAGRVFFVGMRRDVERLLPLMDVFVLPSLYEGFGIAIVEAMAAGRPVVASAVGGIPEIVVPGKTGLLVEPGDPTALAAALERLVGDPDEAREFGTRGQQRARELFDIEVTVKRHAELYRRLAAIAQLSVVPPHSPHAIGAR